VRVQIWSDVVCPWCYVGNARFRAALAAFPHADEVRVEHRSFELDPTWPVDQTGPVLRMLAAKLNVSPAQAQQMEGRLKGLAAAEGLPYTSDRQHGNTFAIHRALHYAAENGKHGELLDALWKALFGDAENVFDDAVLARIAESVGLDGDAVRAVVAGDAYTDEVRSDEQQAKELGITGVPFFVLDGKYGISGCQETDLFGKALQQAWDDRA
jgi:predicted DsbA family dithiol-disulfide isomerase